MNNAENQQHATSTPLLFTGIVYFWSRWLLLNVASSFTADTDQEDHTCSEAQVWVSRLLCTTHFPSTQSWPILQSPMGKVVLLGFFVCLFFIYFSVHVIRRTKTWYFKPAKKILIFSFTWKLKCSIIWLLRPQLMLRSILFTSLLFTASRTSRALSVYVLTQLCITFLGKGHEVVT